MPEVFSFDQQDGRRIERDTGLGGAETVVEGRVVDPENEWNPLRVGKVERIPLEVSGGRAAILCRRWSGRERLAYEDAITERLLQTEQRTGEDTIKIGSLRLFAASLTIIGSEGFETFGLDGFLQGDRPSREEDLLKITDPDTYDEVLRHAMRVQPLPSAGGDDDKSKGGESAEDPSRTLSTPETSTGVAAE